MARVERLFGTGTQKPTISADFKINTNWSADEFKTELTKLCNSEDMRIVCIDLEAKSNQATADVKYYSQSVEELTGALERSKGLGEPVTVALENALRERKDRLDVAKSLKEKLVQFGGLVAMRGGELRGIRERRVEQANEIKTYGISESCEISISAPPGKSPKDYLAEKIKNGLAVVPRSELELMCRKHDIPTAGDTDDRLRDKLMLYQATDRYEIDARLTVREFEVFMSSIDNFELATVLRRSVESPRGRAEVDKEKTNLQLLELREALKTTVSIEVRRLLLNGIKEREATLKRLDELIDKLGKFLVVLDNKGVR